MAYKYSYANADQDLKSKVWWRGTSIEGRDNKIWMSDKCGATMKFSEHGNRESKFGWEIDHIKPTSGGGSDNILNLQPLNWRNNATKGDKYPWDCGD